MIQIPFNVGCFGRCNIIAVLNEVNVWIDFDLGDWVTETYEDHPIQGEIIALHKYPYVTEKVTVRVGNISDADDYAQDYDIRVEDLVLL